METTTKSEQTKKRDVYEIVTDRIMAQLEKGTAPWFQPWTKAGPPQNLITHRHYRGINVMLLASLSFAQNFFLSFKQIKELNASVKEGEKPTMVVTWKWDEPKEGEEKKPPLLRYYNVYNVEQVEGIPQNKIPVITREAYPIIACEKIVHAMPNPPKIQQKGGKAYYHPIDDVVTMPVQKHFDSDESYYTTLFHELIHSTGNIKRLNRKGLLEMAENGGDQYSFEELVAEIGACYLASLTGIEEREFEQHAAYIKGWLEKLKGNKKFIVQASVLAQKATDYILHIERSEIPPEEKESDDLPF